LKLGKIKDRNSRYHLYLLMEDMLKNGKLVGGRLLDIVKRHIVTETDASIISYLLDTLLPLIVYDYIPSEIYSQTYSELFEIIFDQILPSGNIQGVGDLHSIVDNGI
jgi:hypothetical protein